jgi:hypothetical protein
MADWANILEDDLSWREAELVSLKLLVLDALKDSVRQRILLRALWTMCYAHYEGFCKFAWDFYLENLEQIGPTRESCCASVAMFSLAKRFRELRGNLSDHSLWLMGSNEFGDWMKQQLRFELRLETNSNLWPNVLRDNSATVDLPTEMVERHEHHLKALVSRRNDIAHGRNVIIKTLEDYRPYEEAAFLVMHELAIAVLDCLERKTFLKEEQIRSRAYELYERRGKEGGHEVEDWLQAEADVLRQEREKLAAQRLTSGQADAG